MSWRRRTTWTAVAIAAVLAVAVGLGAWWMLDTYGGARWTFERLGAVLPGELQVGQMRGSVRGPLEIRGLLYRTDRAEVLIDRLRLDWRLSAMVQRRIDVRRVEADGVHVRLFAATTPAPRDTTLAELPDVDLPMDFMVQDGVVRNIDITPPAADSAFHIDRVTLSRAAFRDTLTIGALSIQSPRADVEVRGRGTTRGRYSVDLDAFWTYRPADGAPIVGGGRVVGDLDTLHLVQSTERPWRVKLDATATRPLRDLGLRAVLDFVDVPVRTLWPEAPAAMTASGRVDLNGDLARYAVTGAIDATTADWGRWHATLDANADTSAIHLTELVLTTPGRPTRAVVRGAIGTTKTPRLDLTAEWRALAWPFEGPATIVSAAGDLRVQGPLARYRLAGHAVLATPTTPLGRWTVAGTGDARHADLASITGDPWGGHATGTGRLDWGTAVEWRVALAARDLDPNAADGDLRGRVGFVASTHGVATAAGPRGELVVDSLLGRVNALPIAGGGVYAFAPERTEFRDARVSWGPNQLTVSGDVATSWNLAVALRAPSLSGTMPGTAGALDVDGTVTGARDHPRVKARLAADSLRWQSGMLENATADADLDLGPGGALRLDARVVRGHVADRAFETASLAGAGTREHHTIELAIAAGSDSLKAAARGGLFGTSWHGEIAGLDLVSRDFGAWKLEHAAPLRIDPSALALDDFCLASGGGRACVDAAWRADGAWQARSTLDNVPLALAEPLLPATVTLGGTMRGALDMSGADGTIHGEGHLDVGPGEMSYPVGRKTQKTAIRPSQLGLHAGPQGLEVVARLAFGAADTVFASVTMPPPGAPARGARPASSVARFTAATLHARIADLAFVQAFVPQVSNAQGELHADLSLVPGTGGHAWIGKATLLGGADVTRLAIRVHDVALTAEGDAQGGLTLHGSAISGQGTLTLDGKAMVSAGGIQRAHVKVEGSDFLAANRPDARVVVSPRLEATLAGDSLGLSGRVSVPEADLRPAPPKRTALRPSGDVVFVDTLTTDQPPRAPIRLYSEVRVTLGRNVRVRAYGLDARLTGNLLAVDRPDRPTSGSGELTLTEGTYRAYGRTLTIDHGRLLFTGGPLENPVLDVRASRRANDGVVAGFDVTGTMLAPVYTVFSEPAMDERDALAYIVLGHPMDRASQSQQGLVNEAANTLSLTGGDYIARTIGSQFGIEEASVQSGGAFEDASLILGTYLSPRIYVNYGVGIAEPTSTLKIQYFLTRRWTLQAETGSASRADILFTIERGRKRRPPGPPPPATVP